MYVAIEGIDTAGKSTQISLLQKAFPQAFFTLEPGGSELGKRLREILLESEMHLSDRAEFLLFLSDRAEHTHKVLLPHSNEFIISDRSLISGIAYAQTLSFEQSIALNLFATQNIKPDLVILLELQKEELSKRLQAKKQDNIELRGLEYLLEIQNRMVLAAQKLGIRLERIDATLEIEEIHTRIKKALS
ncbi:dTMP kinase [Helicobacter cholecystus]|uniref:Thymidylate kinase n=1 Tax=Helicobacter cholecystus TaxID=45498 RepID=A0A3D8IYJ9_9HELI|nr:dTMP kinase [Helicobacter cholecystus]RDU70066.1 dTMP kinase [Helicobacter cholecystus]VEJ24763.1 thymidylate kinase [Helicobacter cholecystus]